MNENLNREIFSGVEEYTKEKGIEKIKKDIIDIFFDKELERWEREEKVRGKLSEMIVNEEFEAVLDLGKKILVKSAGKYGIDYLENLENLDTSRSDNAVLLTEAINWAAKTVGEEFYQLKPAMIISSWKSGAILGVEEAEGMWPIYYLWAENVGVASFHDPNYEVYELNEKLNEKNEFKEEIPEWNYGWSGIPRQEEAFRLIKAMTEKIDSREAKYYLKRMAVITSPGKNLYEKFKNHKNPGILENDYEVETNVDQNISPRFIKNMVEKYESLVRGDYFEKKGNDNEKLTEIYNKFKSKKGGGLKWGVELNIDEIEFLYELKGSKIISSNEYKYYKRDWRIDKILEIRDIKKDLERVYGEGAVALSPEEIDENTRYYDGFLNESHLDILKNKIKNPFEMSGNLYLNNLTTAEGLTLPQIVGGDLELYNLTTAEGLTLPQIVGGYLSLEKLTIAEGLILPQIVGIGGLDLSNLTNAKNLTFPEIINGDMDLNNLSTAENLTFPRIINGDLDLSNLTNAKNLTFPEIITSDLYLNNLIITENLTFPRIIDGGLHLQKLISIDGLDLPEVINWKIFLNSLSIEEKEKLAEMYPQHAEKILS